MTESLQTARFIYRLLIGICVAGILFAFSPNREVSIQDALEELDKLEALLAEDERGIYLFVDKVMKGIDREVVSHPFFREMEQMARRIGLSHSSHTFEAFAVDFEGVNNLFDSEIWKNKKLFDVIPTSLFTGIENASLEQLEELFLSEFVFESAVPDDVPSFSNQLERQLQARIDSTQVNADDKRFFAMLVYVYLRSTAEPGNADRRVSEAGVQYYLNIKLIDEIASTLAGKSSFGPYNLPPIRNFTSETLGVISGTFESLLYNAPPDLGWSLYSVSKKPINVLAEDEEFKALVVSEGKEVKFLPAIQEFWNELRGKSLSAAREELKRQQRSNNENLTLIGLSVPVDLVVWAYPLALLFVVLYLFLHMRHAMKLAVQNTEPLREFPWIILFSGRFEWIVKYASVTLLPTFAATLVLLRNWSVTDYKWAGILLTLLTLMFCLFVANTVRSLNKQRQNAA